jgi:hypothetical protein
MSFKPAMVQRDNMSADVSAGNPVTAIQDPFGNSYGYSTHKAANPSSADATTQRLIYGVPPTTADPAQWIKNW